MTAVLQPQDGRIVGSQSIKGNEAIDSSQSLSAETTGTTTTTAAPTDVSVNSSGASDPHRAIEKSTVQDTGWPVPKDSQSMSHEAKLEASQHGEISTNATSHVTNSSKGGRTSERDSINALLSLGRDLQGSDLDGTDPKGGSSKRAPESILPDGSPSKASKKRQRKTTEASPQKSSTQQPSSYQHPPDFWYWLSPGESVGEWDVLCGRGGESNNFIGNRKYRKMVNERKPAYREIPVKNRKAKTAFVRAIVQHVNNCGGRFVDLDERSGKYYVVTMDKARKKTSQALRETKELKWLDLSETKERKAPTEKNTVCPYCEKHGHKTKIAKACLKHREWLDANAEKGSLQGTETATSTPKGREQATGSQNAKNSKSKASSVNEGAPAS
jgi:hypothetical protein